MYFPLDQVTTIIPVTAPSEGINKGDYFMAFIVTLIVLLLILIILLVIVLYRNCQRRRASYPNKEKSDYDGTPTKKSPAAKLNGSVSPSKKKYDVIAANGGDGTEKAPDVCIEMSENSKLIPSQEASPTISNGGAKKATSNSTGNIDSASDEKRELTANTDAGDDEKGSLVVNT